MKISQFNIKYTSKIAIKNIKLIDRMILRIKTFGNVFTYVKHINERLINKQILRSNE